MPDATDHRRCVFIRSGDSFGNDEVEATIVDKRGWRANDRIFAILEDGQISENEREEFSNILKTLEKISYSAGSLELWAKKIGFEE